MTFQPGPGIVPRQAKVQAIPDFGALVVWDVLTQAEYESFRDALPTGGTCSSVMAPEATAVAGRELARGGAVDW